MSAMSDAGVSCHGPGMCSERRSGSHHGHTGSFGANLSLLPTAFIDLKVDERLTDHTAATPLHGISRLEIGTGIG